MSDYAEVFAIVEGQSEQKFIKEVLAPYLSERNIFLYATILDKPGEKGGDVRFTRARNDLEKHLKQRPDTFLTFLVDYYGIKNDWPGYTEAKCQTSHILKAETINRATAEEIKRLFPEYAPERRFVPYVSMHELEALYFSDPEILATVLGSKKVEVEDILTECGEPEAINDHKHTIPSERLMNLKSSIRFKKTSTGIAIAQAIGIPKMREACPLFNAWVQELEDLAK